MTTTIGLEADSGVVEAQLAEQAIELVKIEELDHEAAPAWILGLLLDLDTRAQVLAQLLLEVLDVRLAGADLA